MTNSTPSRSVGTGTAPTPYVSTTNACKLCTPLGAALVFKGIEGAVPYLHGSQGCATYMRRYIISHFREPVDIASSALGEKHAVYGGGPNLKQGIRNVIRKYHPKLIGIATTCLTETIGDDVPMILHELRKETEAGHSHDRLPHLIHVSTPSYSGTHMDGFHVAVRAVVDALAQAPDITGTVNLLPGFASPADLRYLKEILKDFRLPWTVLPDISERLDGPALDHYEKIAAGGTPLASIKTMGGATATIQFGRTLIHSNGGDAPLPAPESCAALLAERFGVPPHALGTPIGLRETDAFFNVLETLSGRKTPEVHAAERGRLVDAYVDGHKYVFGKRAVVYGEEDLVIGLTAFLVEIGVRPILCASGGRSTRMRDAIGRVVEGFLPDGPDVREGADFYDIAEAIEGLSPDLLIGNSKGYPLAKKMGIPLIRVGFPLHDRFGAQRMLHVGYRGAQTLFDRIVNAILEKSQMDSAIGYAYL